MAALEVLGMGCGRCVGLFKNAEEAVRQMGRSDSVVKITNYDRILTLNPCALPALAINGKVVVAGRLATPTEIRHFVSEMLGNPLAK